MKRGFFCRIEDRGNVGPLHGVKVEDMPLGRSSTALLASLIALIPIFQVRADTVYRTVEMDGIVDRAIIVSSRDFTHQNIDRLCQEFLTLFGPTRGLRRLIIATREDTIRFALFNGSGPLTEETSGHAGRYIQDQESSYDRTVARIKSHHLPQGPIARVIAFNDAALLTIRDAQNYTERLVAGKENPTLLHDGKISYRLLHFSVTPPGPAVRKGDYATSIVVEAKPEISVASAARLVQRLASVVRGGQVSVTFGLDAFFPGDWTYPALTPFSRNPVVPDKTHYLYRGELSCGVVGNSRIFCSGDQFHP